MTYASYLIAALATLAAAYLGLTQTLGAHPFWATQIAWIGIPIGLLAAWVLAGRSTLLRLTLFAALLIATATAAHFGKLEFAASFAENATAGKLWYFGWIGIAASATALVASLLQTAVSRQS
jgi:hypothetical protein